MATSPFQAAIQQICSEKGISEERVIETIESAIAAAYRRDYGQPGQVMQVKLVDGDATNFKVYQLYEVLADDAEIEDADRQVHLSDAQAQEAEIKAGEELRVPLPFHDDFGRIAAQTAKQVIVQRLREAERDVLYEEFKDKENVLLNGSVQQVDGENVIISLGKVNAIMPPREQIRGEYYSTGQRIKVYVKEVAESLRGPQIIVSRADSRFIRELFALEVPEIPAGTVEIRAIAREAGSRTKMAVAATVPSIDPSGSCIGRNGTRVSAVLSEIGDEKIDVVLWNEKPEAMIRNALSPLKEQYIRSITLNEERKHAAVDVDPEQLSVAIGKGGQNVRLASKLSGYTIDIVREELPPTQ